MKTQQPPPPTPCSACHLSLLVCTNRATLGREPCCAKCHHPSVVTASPTASPTVTASPTASPSEPTR
jgi:hypothetical protein